MLNEKHDIYTKISLNDYVKAGNDHVIKIKELLFNDSVYQFKLIQKGFLSPNGTFVIRQNKLTNLITEVAKGNSPELEAEQLMHRLGCSKDDVKEIPLEAFSTPLYAPKILGQNRVAYMRMSNIDYQHGLMLGGLGTGGVERTPDGDFRRISITHTGQNIEDAENNRATQFHIFMQNKTTHFASVLNTGKPTGTKLSHWKWELDKTNGSYHALYPMEWHKYRGDTMPGNLTITSFSPILKDNYRESSYPVIIYTISITNTGTSPLDAGFMFSLQNLVGRLPHSLNATAKKNAYREVEREQSMGIRHLFTGDMKSGTIKDFISNWDPARAGCTNRITVDEHGNHFLILKGKKGDIIDANGEIAIAMPGDTQATITYVTTFDADSDGNALASFYETGELNNTDTTPSCGNNIAGALAFKVKAVPPSSTVEIPVVLAYDFPYSKQGEQVLTKRYTKFFGTSGNNGAAIAKTGLDNHAQWKKAVIQSQKDIILDNPDVPGWYKGAALNKLNLLQTNCVGWFNNDDGTLMGSGHKSAEAGLHLMGESNKIDYEFVETWDVRSYSFARALLWPALDQSILTYFTDTVTNEDTSPANFIMKTPHLLNSVKDQFKEKMSRAKNDEEKEKLEHNLKAILRILQGPRKLKNATPHDIWSAPTGPLMNAYLFQNANYWPGLPPRGMLQALRNYYITNDHDAFAYHYAGFSKTLDYAKEHLDLNNDCIPDFIVPPSDLTIALWTYDDWKWTNQDGINAYTTGLWLTSLAAAVKGAQILSLPDDEKKYREWLDIGRTLFDQHLWKAVNADEGYYKLGENVEDIFSDYLYFFYSKILKLDIFPEDKIKKTLRYVYNNNVQKIANGYFGAVNGTRDGKIIPEGEQGKEMWTGTSFALGATMLAYGLKEEGWNVIYGTENFITNEAGNFGDWAEAYTLEPGTEDQPAYGVRAKNYLRVLSIFNVLAI